MKGQNEDCPSGSTDTIGVLDNRREKGNEKHGGNNAAMTSVEITPVKAPNDIKSAIRRQKRTETLDYIWHALPVSRTARPLYRAVLRGSLQPDSIQYTITNANGHTVRTADVPYKDNSLPSGNDPNNNNNNNSYNNNNNNNISQSGLSLKVAGISISDIKFQDPSAKLPSPRARSGRSSHVSRHMKPNFLELKTSTSGNAFKQKRAEYLNEGDFDRLTLPRDLNLSSRNPSNGVVYQMKNSNSGKVQLFSSIPDGEFQPQSPTDDDMECSLGVNDNGNDIKNGAVHDGKTGERMMPPDPNAPSKTGKSPKASDAEKQCNTVIVHREKAVFDNKSNIESHPLVACKPKFVQKSYRLPDTHHSQQSKNASIHELSCLQLANSILGAADGDFTEVYSLCKSKVRYSDFIEQSQPHRLGNSSLQRNPSSLSDIEFDPSYKERMTSPDVIQPVAPKPQAKIITLPSSKSVTKETTRLPVINNSTKPKLQLRTSSQLTSNPRTKEDEIDFDKPSQMVEIPLPFCKVGRPILKTFKSEMESVMSTADDLTPRNDNNKIRDTPFNDTNSRVNMNNNRLVRFNTCHEVREFTPSEPIMQW